MNDMRFKMFAYLVAEGIEYDTEYDGKMYTHCGYCNATLSEGEEHEKDCSMLNAQQALGKDWFELLKQRQLAAEAVMFKPSNMTDYINCDICDKRIASQGLRAHKKDSLYCKQIKSEKKNERQQNKKSHQHLCEQC